MSRFDKMVVLSQILTRDEIVNAYKLYGAILDSDTDVAFDAAVINQILTPQVMERINAELGAEVLTAGDVAAILETAFMERVLNLARHTAVCVACEVGDHDTCSGVSQLGTLACVERQNYSDDRLLHYLGLPSGVGNLHWGCPLSDLANDENYRAD